MTAPFALVLGWIAGFFSSRVSARAATVDFSAAVRDIAIKVETHSVRAGNLAQKFAAEPMNLDNNIEIVDTMASVCKDVAELLHVCRRHMEAGGGEGT